MVTSNLKDKAMMKRFLFYLALLVFPMFGFAQDSIDTINEIKLSGKYFTAEATASDENEAKELAFMGLIGKLWDYCEEMDLAEIEENKVKASLQSKSIKRGNAILVMVYVDKGIVNGKDAKFTFIPNSNTSMNTSQMPSGTNISGYPDVIQRICNIETYAGMQYFLDKAMDNAQIANWGKYRTMANPDACYLVMVNADRQVVGVLSPKRNGARVNLKTNAVLDAKSMNTFTNCVPICVLTK